jgi:hypothetical protein
VAGRGRPAWRPGGPRGCGGRRRRRGRRQGGRRVGGGRLRRPCRGCRRGRRGRWRASRLTTSRTWLSLRRKTKRSPAARSVVPTRMAGSSSPAAVRAARTASRDPNCRHMAGRSSGLSAAALGPLSTLMATSLPRRFRRRSAALVARRRRAKATPITPGDATEYRLPPSKYQHI